MQQMNKSTMDFFNRWKNDDGVEGFSIQNYRTVLADVVNIFLTDLDEVAERLRNDTPGSLWPLTMCQKFLGDHPDIFSQACQDSDSATEDERTANAFCFWCIRHLLRLLSQPDCSGMHSVIIKLIQDILDSILTKSKYTFRQFILEFIKASAELIQLRENLYNAAETTLLTCFDFDVDLVQQSLKDSTLNSEIRKEDEITVKKTEITLTEISHCECLQANIFKILQGLLLKIDEWARSYVNILWGCLCCNLEKGDFDLKMVSLETLMCLISILGIPPSPVSGYFLSCFIGIWELLCTQQIPWNNGEKEQLEQTVAKFTSTLICCDKNGYLTSKTTFLHRLVEKLCYKGLTNISCLEARKAVVSLFVYVLKKVSWAGVILEVDRPYLDILADHALTIFGTESSSEYIVPLLVQLVLLECGNVDNSLDVSTRILSEDSNTPVRRPGVLSRKRKAYGDTTVKAINSRVFAVLLDRMSALTAEKFDFVLFSQTPSGQKLECLHIIIRVASDCMSYLSAEGQTRSPLFTELSISSAVDCWTNYVRNVSNEEIDMFKVRYSTILASVTAMLIVNDIYGLPAIALQEISWIVTLPWIASDLAWKDMKPLKPKEIASIAFKLADRFDVDLMCQCIQTLVLLPKEACAAWKKHVILQAVSDNREEITRTIIQCFPLLLHNLGPKSNYLVKQVLVPILDSPMVAVFETLASRLGEVVLTMIDAGRMERPSIDEFVLDVSKLHIIVSEEFDKQQLKEKGKSLDLTCIVPFLKLLKYSEAKVRKSALHSLATVFLLLDLNLPEVKTMISSCLDLLNDPDKDVRMECCSLIPCIVSNDAGKCSADATDNFIWQILESMCRKRHLESTGDMETILMSVGQFGRVVDGQLLGSVIVCLLQHRISQQLVEEALAYEELQNIASFKGESLQQIYTRVKPIVMKFLVVALYSVQQASDDHHAKNILVQIARTLAFDDLKAFLQGSEKHMLPFLVSKASPEATKLIRLISGFQVTETSRRTFLVNNARYIFSYVVRYCQKEDMERALNYMQTETEFSLGNLLLLDFQRVHNELLLHLSTHYQQVFIGLKILAGHDQQYKGPKDIESEEQMAQYLESRLLGVLFYFDSQLTNRNITLEDKELALKSVISIIRLMGSKHICSIRHKAMNTLRLGLQFTEPSVAEISCKAWNCFVKSLEIPLLGVMMSQIIATLLPLLKILPVQVAEIFNYMIVENRDELSTHFQEIYFLPDIPELAEANKLLKQFGENSANNSDLKTLLAHSIKGISHESHDVRVHALSKLRKLLREKRVELSSFVLNSEPPEPILSELVTALLSGCRDTDYRTQILYGQCLGELGAIDAGRLELITKGPDVKLASFHSSVSNDDFAYELINVVVKAFLAATEPRVQDSASFALQELLQVYKIREAGDHQNGTSKGKLWDRFPDQTQEILIPLLNSKYKLIQDTNYASFPRPLYLSEKGNNLVDWISNWTGYLITKVKPGIAEKVFKACSPMKRHSQQVTFFILPHIILQVLQNGNAEDTTEMYGEIMAVLQKLQKQDLRHESASNFHHMSAQTMFSVLDYLTMWRSHQAEVSVAKCAAYDKDPNYLAVDTFLKRIPQDVIAYACFNCKAYTRALRHFEMFVKSTDNIQQHLDFMQRIYVAMDEPDGVLGAAAVRVSQPTLMQQILTHESLGQQQDAQACYERAIQMEPDKISHHHGLLRSLMDLAQPNKALFHTAGILAERQQWRPHINSYRIEAAWKLGSWDELDKALKTEQQSNCNWPVLVGRMLLAYKHGREADFIEQLEIARKEQMGPLSAASMEIGSYHRGYENILRLHMISEIEEFFHVLVDFPESKDNNTNDVIMLPSASDLLNNWQARIQMAQSSFRTQEPILTLRRTLLSMVHSERHPNLDTQIGKWWLWSAKVARKAGYLQSAYGCLLQASSYNLPEFYVEQAKWLYEKGEADAAITCLEKGISEHFGDMSQAGRKERLNSTLKEVYAQSLLLYGKYSEEVSNLEINAIFKQYRDVIDVCPEWEDGYFHLAKYYDKVMNNMEKDKIEKQGEFIIQVVKYFGNSLKYGNQHIYQSLPRLLSLWLDYGAVAVDTKKRESSEQQQTQRRDLMRINEAIEQLSKQLAPYQMFTAFSQLISRICHAQPEIFQQLQEIISGLLVAYPHQAIWMMMAVSKSSHQMRVTRCTSIFAKSVEKDGSLNKFIQDCRKLTDRLLELCEKDVGNNVTSVSLSKSFKPLKRLLEDSNFSQILLPLQSLVTVKLPSKVTSGMHHSPFPDNLIYIKGFEDTIEVLPSLAKPKKITMVGSDGKRYVMMCKPKDDLRKDCRLMEFNTIVNKFLRRDAECRKRQLLIRTYNVTPLNEECGIIEWVNNTTGLRHILIKLYKEKGLHMNGRELKAVMLDLHASKDAKLKVFKEKLLPRHPAIFSEWFYRKFPDPTSWYNARVSYARTAAVMSIVGYILGLGDRHGENILLDSNTGDCVHVDFNCLFNKGETFEWAERVPFRLTHNMIEALGPLGCEGLFRRSCEMTLKVIRDQMDSLMSVLTTFIYDPLVEWSKASMGQRSNATNIGEINLGVPKIHVQNIEDRIRGILKTKKKPRCLPLSIEGHVKYLIQEATSEINLCQMYIGWAAYM
ncbi:hypothetical protein BsWGS_01693 [Bradybaena similaris]